MTQTTAPKPIAPTEQEDPIALAERFLNLHQGCPPDNAVGRCLAVIATLSDAVKDRDQTIATLNNEIQGIIDMVKGVARS